MLNNFLLQLKATLYRLLRKENVRMAFILALLTGSASSSFGRNYPLPMTLSEQKKKAIFLKIRENPSSSALLSIAGAAQTPQSRVCSRLVEKKESCLISKSTKKHSTVFFNVKPKAKKLALSKGELHTFTSLPIPTTSTIQNPKLSKQYSSSRRYRYLNQATRQTINQVPVRRNRWKYIIVHNSGTQQGNAHVFDTYHRKIRRMKNGLAYHFVIGNGHPSGNGQIEVGNRWRRQINGGHVASDYINKIALGICLVGDFNRHAPTPQQLVAFEELTSYLQTRLGHSKRRRVLVLGHWEMNSKPTDCPGNKFPLRWLHKRFQN